MKSKNFEHRWSILCTTSSVDTKDNNVSLFNIIEQVRVTRDLPISGGKESGGKIFVPMGLEIVSLWEKIVRDQDAKTEVELDFQNPEGKSIQKFHYTVSTPKKRLRHFVKLDGFPIFGEGRYTFKVRSRNEGEEQFEDVGEIPLEVSTSYTFPQSLKKSSKAQFF